MLETSYSDEALDLARTASHELAKLDGPRIAVFDLGGLIPMLHRVEKMVRMETS